MMSIMQRIALAIEFVIFNAVQMFYFVWLTDSPEWVSVWAIEMQDEIDGWLDNGDT